MIALSDDPVFKKCTTSLSETSRSDACGDENAVMLQSSLPVVCFDDVVKEYKDRIGLIRLPCSADALYEDHEGRLFLIEFKSGHLKGKLNQILDKGRDSVLVLGDMLDRPLSWFRKNCSFILVFNHQKNPNARDGRSYRREPDEVLSSPSYEQLARSVMSEAGKEIVSFGLEFLEGYCYSRVNTLTVDEFLRRYALKWENSGSSKGVQ